MLDFCWQQYKLILNKGNFNQHEYYMPHLKLYPKASEPTVDIIKKFRPLFIGGALLFLLIILLLIIRSILVRNTDPSLENICNLNLGGCTVQLTKEQSIHLMVSPTPFKAGIPLTFTVTLQGFPYPNNMQVLLATLDKNSAPTDHEQPMKQISQTNYETQIALNDRGDDTPWVVMILLKTRNNKEHAVPFTLTAEKKEEPLMDAVQK